MARLSGCPICEKPIDPAFRPFCSRACANRDLLKWLGEGYAIAGAADDAASDEAMRDPRLDKG
jgi:uncharacterized protein